MEEKASIGSNATANTESYAVKLSALHGMGIAMSKNALVKRVNWALKLCVELEGKEVTVEEESSVVSGITPALGVSDGGDIAKWTSRPKGSTDNKKRENSTKLFECINSITLTYSTEKSKLLPPKSRLPNGFLRDLIESNRRSMVPMELYVTVTLNNCRISSQL